MSDCDGFAQGPAFLGPMAIGQLFDRNFRLMWTRFTVLFGIALAPMAFSLLILVAIGAAVATPIFSHWPKPPLPGLFPVVRTT